MFYCFIVPTWNKVFLLLLLLTLTLLDDCQHTISVIYIESYWLFYSNRENTWNGPCGSKSGKTSLKQVQHSAKLIVTTNITVISDSQS